MRFFAFNYKLLSEESIFMSWRDQYATDQLIIIPLLALLNSR